MKMEFTASLLIIALLCCQLGMICSDAVAENEDAQNAAVQGINSFSKSLYQVLSGPDTGNLVMSPFSVEAVVSMLLLGLRGDTAKQVSAALRLPEDQTKVAQGFKTLLQSLQNTDNVTLEIANKIYIQQGFNVKDDFRMSTQEYFQSVAEEVDIAGNSEKVRRNVNDWAAKKTHDKIQDLLAPGTLTPDVVMILLNAIYFKGLWKTSFKNELTSDGEFHLNTTSKKAIPMMHLSARFDYGELNDAQVLKMPYQGGKHSMLILLPKSIEGLAQLESNINNLDISMIKSNMWSRKVEVTLPRFKILSTIDLNDPLVQLGMGQLFGGGNFSGVSDEPIVVSKAIQKAFIEVNEEGTEAAAVTALIVVGVTSIMGPPDFRVEFIADHPFMYMIVEEEMGTILFMGRYVAPEE